jgi:mRNA interferase MazF
MQRGEVWWVEFEQRRPVVLLSGDAASGFQALQIVPPAGVEMAGLGIEVPVGPPKGCRTRAWSGWPSRTPTSSSAPG